MLLYQEILINHREKYKKPPKLNTRASADQAKKN